ncbi:MAG: hypothetical protein AB8H03_21715 [Saprospiraceae bacterium]
MKNSIIAFFLISLFISIANISFGQSEDLAVIEKSINVEKFKQYLAKDEAGKALPMIIVSNKKFSNNLEIDFDGKKVNVFENLKESDLEDGQAFIDVTKFKVRGQLSILKFNYGGYKVKVKFRKIDNEWTYQSFNIKGNGTRYIHMDSTF